MSCQTSSQNKRWKTSERIPGHEKIGPVFLFFSFPGPIQQWPSAGRLSQEWNTGLPAWTVSFCCRSQLDSSSFKRPAEGKTSHRSSTACQPWGWEREWQLLDGGYVSLLLPLRPSNRQEIRSCFLWKRQSFSLSFEALPIIKERRCTTKNEETCECGAAVNLSFSFRTPSISWQQMETTDRWWNPVIVKPIVKEIQGLTFKMTGSERRNRMQEVKFSSPGSIQETIGLALWKKPREWTSARLLFTPVILSFLMAWSSWKANITSGAFIDFLCARRENEGNVRNVRPGSPSGNY